MASAGGAEAASLTSSDCDEDGALSLTAFCRGAVSSTLEELCCLCAVLGESASERSAVSSLKENLSPAS